MEEPKEPLLSVRKKRRTILGWLLGGSLTAVVAPILYVAGRFMGYKGIGAQTQAVLPISDVSAEHPSKLLSINDEPILVIYQPDGGIRAFTAKCTHLGCTVSY